MASKRISRPDTRSNELEPQFHSEVVVPAVRQRGRSDRPVLKDQGDHSRFAATTLISGKENNR